MLVMGLLLMFANMSIEPIITVYVAQIVADSAQVTIVASVGTVDDEVWKMSEPGTPHPRRPLEACRC